MAPLNTATEAFRPQGGYTCWLLEKNFLTSALKAKFDAFVLLIFHHKCCMASFILVVADAPSAILMRLDFVFVFSSPCVLPVLTPFSVFRAASLVLLPCCL